MTVIEGPGDDHDLRTREVGPALTAGGYERARPIFDRAARSFHPITHVVGVEVGTNHLSLRLATRAGPAVHAQITFPDPHVVRLHWAFGRAPGPHRTEMLVGEPPTLRLEVTQLADRIVVEAGGPALTLDRFPWQVRFGGYASEPRDTSLVEPVAEAGGWAADADRVWAYETFALRPGEQLYGLGERFHGPSLRGKRLAHWIDQPFGTNTTDKVMKSVPLLVSNRGYGVFVHHPEEAWFDLGAGSTASASYLVQADQLDTFVILGEPKQVLERYTVLTGRAPVPPDWSFGLWASRCMYRSRAEVLEVLDRFDELGIAIDAVNLDPLWMAIATRTNGYSADFVPNTADFGDIADLAAELHGRGVRLCLWLNPLVHETSPAWDPDRLVAGGAARERYGPDRAFVDFTGAGGDWWRDEIAALMAAGVDAVKLDHGEVLPVDVRLADGRGGAEAHNLYPLLASIVAASAGAPVAFTRAGTAGSQRYPVHWAGDTQATWAGLAGAIRGGLAASWSGFAHWTADLGGFYLRDLHYAHDDDLGFRQPEPELYVRWLQTVMLLSHTRFHGNQPREPWHFGDAAVDVARTFAALRRSLRPYLLDCAQEAAATGVPVLRPLAMEFPDDRGAAEVDTEYLLGPALLVCPVLEPGGRVELYLPPGGWTDHFSGERAEGPGWVRREVPLAHLPLYVRDDHQPFERGTARS